MRGAGEHRQIIAPRRWNGLGMVALFEGTKGLLVLLAGFELLTFVHRDLHRAAVLLVEHLHLNPASHYPRIFLDSLEHVNDANLRMLALAAAVYSLARFVEAIGLWLRRGWAEWFAVLSGGVYVPVELYEAVQRPTWPRLTLLAINLGIVAYVSRALICSYRERRGMTIRSTRRRKSRSG